MTPINRSCPLFGKKCMQCTFYKEVRFRPRDETYEDCEVYQHSSDKILKHYNVGAVFLAHQRQSS